MNLFHLKDLIGLWAEKNLSQEEKSRLLQKLWEKITPSPKASFGQFIDDKSELVIEVENHSLLSDLQFQKIGLLAEINRQLKEESDLILKKIRFRLKKKAIS